jgi:hypothetical protein
LPKTKLKPRQKNKGLLRSSKAWEESIMSHIGKAADNMSLKDWAELALMGGIAYAGYSVGGIPGLIIGPLGYKLATTMGGTPPVSQIAGLGILGGIGLLALTPPAGMEITEPEEIITIPGTPFIEEIICPPGWEPMYMFGVGWQCVQFPPGF